MRIRPKRVVVGILLAGVLASCTRPGQEMNPSASAGLPTVGTSGASPSAGAYAGVSWHTVQIPAAFSLSPLLAPAGDTLYMVGSTRVKTQVQSASDAITKTQIWSSSDATTWSQGKDPLITDGFVPRALGTDGTGGLVLVGYVLTPDEVIPQIWHSSDGSTFKAGQLAGIASISGPTEIVSVASGSGVLVALGDHQGTGTYQGLDAWLSTDASAWTRVALPQAAGYQALSIGAWSKGFAAVGFAGGTGTASVWTSPDGASWTKNADVDAVAISSIVAVGDRLVLLGAKADSQLGMVPASWSSSDGATWTESSASGSEPAMEFDAATVVGGSILAIGTSHVGVPASTLRPDQSLPTPTFRAWLSADGLNWRILGNAPAFSLYLTSVTSFQGRPVVASTLQSGVAVSVGDPTASGR